MVPDDKHWRTYGRLSYDRADNVTAIVEAGYAGSDTHNGSAAYNRQGASAIIVSRENPYLPLAMQQAMDDAGVTEFAMNRLFYDKIGRASCRERVCQYV